METNNYVEEKINVEESQDVILDENEKWHAMCALCKIRAISNKNSEEVNSKEICCLLDILRETLIMYGLLSEDNRLIDVGEIDVTRFTHSQMSKALGVIIDKLASVMYVNGLLD